MVSIRLEDYALEICHSVNLGDVEPDSMLEQVDVTIKHTVWDDESDESEVISVGSARLYYVDWERVQGYIPFDVFDAKSQLLHEIYNALYKDLYATPRRPLGPVLYNSVLILDELRITPNHRGCGLGTHVVQSFIGVLGRRAGIFALKPFPIDFKSEDPAAVTSRSLLYRKELERVERFYRRVGFRKVPRTKIMYLIPDT